jgi:hypothetical protein
MTNTIKNKNSVVPGKVPTTGDLTPGEIAINQEDGKVYIAKTTSGTVTSVVDVGATRVHATAHYPGGSDPVNSHAFHGVVSRTTIAPLPVNITTTTFTLSCATTPLTYYNNSVQYVVNTNVSTTIGAAAGLYFVYFDATGTLVNSTTFPGLTSTSGHVIIASVFWNGTNFGAVNDERHGFDRDTAWHLWAHNTVGTRYGAGLAFTFAGTTNANTTFSVSAGNIYDEDINFTVPTTTTCRVLRQTSASAYSLVTASSTLPYLYSAGIQAVRADTFALVTANQSARYFNVFLYATTDVDVPVYAIVETVAVGNIAGYTTVANARAASLPSLAGMGISPEYKFLYRLIVNGTGQIQALTAADDYRAASVLPSGGTASSTASSVTYTPTAPDSATTVQQALDARVIINPANVAITGGAIDSTVIGGTTRASGHFTLVQSDNYVQAAQPGDATAADGLSGGLRTYGGASIAKTLYVGGNVITTGTVTGSNLSGTNTGDQNLSGYTLNANAAITGGTISGITLSTPSDITVNGMTVGKGNGSDVGNLAFGTNALATRTSGSLNVAFGANSLYSASDAITNLAIGGQALQLAVNTQNQIGIGYAVLQNFGAAITSAEIIPGYSYKIISPGSTSWTSIGSANNNAGTTFTATGPITGTGTCSGSINNAHNNSLGSASTPQLRVGSSNTAIGGQSMLRLKAGTGNTLIGRTAGQVFGRADYNTAVGSSALANTTGLVASTALSAGTTYIIHATGTSNFVNAGALTNVIGAVFTATGTTTGNGTAQVFDTTKSNYNTALGAYAGTGTSGSNGTILGSNNLFLGYNTVGTSSSNDNEIVIGANAVGTGSNTTVIGNSSTTQTNLYGNVIATGTVTGSNLSGTNTGDQNLSGYTLNANAAITGGTITGGTISGVSLSTSSDALVNGLTLGLGAGNSSTNFAFGTSALASNVFGTQSGAIGNLALQNMGKVQNAGGFIVGITYQIIFSGDTNFTTIGAADNNVGTSFTATGIGSGTGTAAPVANNSFRNLAIGFGAMADATAGVRNIAVGRSALRGALHPQQSLALGNGAGYFANGIGTVSIGTTANCYSGPASGSLSIGLNAGLFLSNIPVTQIVAGNQYVASYLGNTDFTLIGADGNYEEVLFTATGAGTGTGYVMPYATQNTGDGNNNLLIGTCAGAPAADDITGFLPTNALTTGTNNIMIGSHTGTSNPAITNSIVIGNDSIVDGSNKTVIGNSSTTSAKIFGELTVTGNVIANGVTLGSGGGGGTTYSAGNGITIASGVISLENEIKNLAMFLKAYGNTSLGGQGTLSTSTSTAPAKNTTNMIGRLNRVRIVTSNSANVAVYGVTSTTGTADPFTRGDIAGVGGFTYQIRVASGDLFTSGQRRFIGIGSQTAALTTAEPSAGIADAVGMCLDSTDTNWQVIRRTGSGTAVKVDTGLAAAADQLFDITISCASNSSSMEVKVELIANDASKSTILSDSYTSDLPANTTYLGARNYVVSNAASTPQSLEFVHLIGYRHDTF